MAHGRFPVTGGCGFIGSHLGVALVRVLDNFTTGRRENLAEVAADVEILHGDVCDPAVVDRAVTGVDHVLHQAALASVQRSVDDPLATHAADPTGTLNVLHAARDAGVRRVLYAASAAAYGDDPTLPKHEDLPPRPLSPYAAAKLAGEQYCAAFARSYGLETVTLRYFNVYGPRQDPRSSYASVVPRFVTGMLRHAAPTIFGDGTHSRDFTHVDDVVAANLLALVVAEANGGRSISQVVSATHSWTSSPRPTSSSAPRPCPPRATAPRGRVALADQYRTGQTSTRLSPSRVLRGRPAQHRRMVPGGQRRRGGAIH